MPNVSQLKDDIKSKTVYFILKGFQKYIDERGNFPAQDWTKIFNDLVSDGVFIDADRPLYLRTITSLTNPYHLLRHHNGAMYSLTDEGNLMVEKWSEEYDNSQSNGEQESITIGEIKRLQSILQKQIGKNEESYYLFSVFICHSNFDYIDLHPLLLEMISRKIKPIVWFEEVEEDVKDKLCNKIANSDLFLLYITNNSVSSQMTNNEIGFVEGKRYFNRIEETEPPIVLKMHRQDFDISKLGGFYTRGKDLVAFEPENPDDIIRIIEILSQRYFKLPTPTSPLKLDAKPADKTPQPDNERRIIYTLTNTKEYIVQNGTIHFIIPKDFTTGPEDSKFIKAYGYGESSFSDTDIIPSPHGKRFKFEGIKINRRSFKLNDLTPEDSFQTPFSLVYPTGPYGYFNNLLYGIYLTSPGKRTLYFSAMAQYPRGEVKIKPIEKEEMIIICLS